MEIRPRRCSARAGAIRPSATLELSARAKALAAAGEPVINLSAGEPDLPTPAPVVEAAHRALDEGHFGYTAAPGVPPLRAALADQYSGRLGVDFAPQQVVVTNGAKQALFNALSTCTDAGDRVGVLAPYWVTYAEVTRALGCEPVMIECPASLQFRPDPDALRAALHEGLRVLIVNSPGNPTGAAYRADDFAPILAAVAETDTLMISDEIYEEIVFVDGGHVSPLHVRPDLADRICVITGFSKAFAMTGWRVGFSLAPLDWSKAMGALQGHVTSNVNAVAQQAALTALTRRDLVAPMIEVFHRRRDRVTEQITLTPGLSAMEPEGTFYSFMDVSALLGDGGYAADVDALCARLLDEHQVVVVPGTAFGNDHHARLSFAASDADLDGAFERLRAAFS